MTDLRDRSVAELLAADDDRAAWEELVDRYGRLVWTVARSFRLDDATAADVTQQVWLRLVEHRHQIRDPERLPSWLATTARREALSVLRGRKRESPVDLLPDAADPADVPVDERVVEDLHSEIVHQRVRAAFAELSDGCQYLLRLLTAEPHIDYETISGLIGRPVGSIGPTRGRCLAELRNRLEQTGEAI